MSSLRVTGAACVWRRRRWRRRPHGLVDQEPLCELVARHGQQVAVEGVDFASQAPVVAYDHIGSMRECGGGHVTVLAVHGRHRGGGDVAFVVSVK